ncbi:hypothetical protein M5K25_022035 [Dendrobium thyrsiflorum]|uniref:Uncharacterized protein n=1 Tax=Dendrobium thyrsiflorum TaxID=117978 RepID=A0ABD0UB37_DENTH
MAGTTSSIISNLLSSLKRLSQVMPIFTSLTASSSSSSSSIVGDEVMVVDVNSIQESLMEDVSRLSRMLQRIQALLDEAEEREVHDKQTQLWLSELRKVAYDAEDILDQFDYQIIKTQVEGMAATVEKPSPKGKQVDDDGKDFYGYQVSLPSSTSIKIPISCDMAMMINEIIRKFDEIAKDKKALQLREVDAPRRPCLNDVTKRPPSSSLVYESDVFGREDEKRKIIQLLMSQSEKENNIIPIVGMGGVGKTTLAQLVYNDLIVCQHFSPKVWVCVSKEFDVLGVTKEIVKSIIKSSIHEDNNNLNDLHCILKEALLDKKFLLILDDVWNERPDMWEAFQAPFSGIRMGKIIVTTRSMSVARIMQTVSPLKLECLHEENSWLLFQRHAFYGWEPNQQLNFEQIGRGIIKKCGGLPLALKAVGGFLRFEFKEQIWKYVLNNNLWELEETKNLILPALRISYNYLPTHLKPCFLYASLCPKNYSFCKLEMMGMWIAQGYIQLAGRKRLLEDLAFEFFEDLVRRSFFQCSQFQRFQPEKERRFEELFSLHDMVHDLAQSITKNEICALLNFSELKDIPKDAKHIFLKHTKVNQILLHGAIRTLDNIVSDHLYGVLDQSIFSKQSFSYLGYLRVLRFDAPNFDCSFQFVNLISNMHQLCFLSIYVRTILLTEYSFLSLYKLQTLILQSCYINMIPQAIGKLINLRHLMIQSKNRELMLETSFGFENLLTFYFDSYCGYCKIQDFFESKFHLRRDGSYSIIQWLKHLMNLQGSLEIYGLENVIDHEDAKSANLLSKPYIDSLRLDWANNKYDECSRNDEVVLQGLEPHTNLKELIMNGYNGSGFPSWFGNPCFSNLTKIKLRNFYNKEECKFLPLSKLPSLTSLEIRNIRGITKMGQDFWCCKVYSYGRENYFTKALVGFHSSEYLTNKSLPEWREQPMVNNGEFSSLKYLHITFCSKLQQISTLPLSLEEFSVHSCKRLEYIALPYSSGHLSRLQKVKIYLCGNLKSMINLNNLVGSLKVLELASCGLLMPDPDEDFDHSFGRVPFEKGIACVFKCPGMKEWCQRHDLTYEEDWTHPKVLLKLEELMSADWDSDDNSRDKVLKRGILALEVLNELRDNSFDEALNEAVRALLALHV